MKKIKITRVKLISFIVAAKKYIEEVGAKETRLSAMCVKVLEYEPNVEILLAHNKLVEKLQKQLRRDHRDAEIDFGKTENGVLVKGASSELLFAPDEQKKLNKELDKINDKYIDDLEKLGDEIVEFYFPSVKVTDLPSSLPAEYKKSLSLLM